MVVVAENGVGRGDRFQGCERAGIDDVAGVKDDIGAREQLDDPLGERAPAAGAKVGAGQDNGAQRHASGPSEADSGSGSGSASDPPGGRERGASGAARGGGPAKGGGTGRPAWPRGGTSIGGG